MSQKLERNLLRREYSYDDGTYIIAIDIGYIEADFDLGFSNGHFNISVSRDGQMVGTTQIPVTESIVGEPEMYYNNGIATFEGEIRLETTELGSEDGHEKEEDTLENEVDDAEEESDEKSEE